jgi:ketosteroid isomerase-like protein
MSERADAERIIRELHAARCAGNLPAMVSLFADQGRFRIAGASSDKPIAIDAADLPTFRPWLHMLVRAFKVENYRLLSLIVEWPQACAHWEADIFSKITGVSVATELVDLVEIADGKILRYSEFFAPHGRAATGISPP